MIYKFRTMSGEYDEHSGISDEERLTKFGRILRKTSLDELPQLFNILKGDMSFVGPRPLPTVYCGLYSSFQNRRHEVRPGLTGLSIVNGRNTLSWDKRFRLDVEYVDGISFICDMKIIFKTFVNLLKGDGDGFSEKFTGSN